MKRRSFFQFSPIARRVSIGLVIVSVLAVAGYLFASHYFAPEKIAQRELTRIAEDYYENFFYDNFVADLPESEQAAAFEKYVENGFPRVTLSDLLLYDDEKHASSEQYFNYQNYTCDVEKTYVQFFPQSPFGKTDYEIARVFHCE